MSLVLYHEKQAAMLCGQHCLNNLMQAPIFSLEMLSKIARELDAEERKVRTKKVILYFRRRRRCVVVPSYFISLVQ